MRNAGVTDHRVVDMLVIKVRAGRSVRIAACGSQRARMLVGVLRAYLVVLVGMLRVCVLVPCMRVCVRACPCACVYVCVRACVLVGVYACGKVTQ